MALPVDSSRKLCHIVHSYILCMVANSLGNKIILVKLVSQAGKGEVATCAHEAAVKSD